MTTSKKKLNQPEKKKNLFVVLWILCILGSWSVIPYTLQMGILPSVSFTKIFIPITIQSALAFGVVCWLSYLLVPKTDLSPFSFEYPVKKILIPGVSAGIIVGLALRFLDATIFKNSPLSGGGDASSWVGLLASFYGGINEEVLLRLFFLTFVYFLCKKIFKFHSSNRLVYLWFANVITAIFFGLGHLPAAFKLVTPSAFEIFRVLLLNGLASIIFGWLYWSRGLWTAMVAHFVADLMLHVVHFQ